MNPVELLVYAASWQLLAMTPLELMLAPRGVVTAAKEVIRTQPLSREEFAVFKERLFPARTGESPDRYLAATQPSSNTREDGNE